MSVAVRIEPEVMTLTAAAITCGVSDRTVRRWADDGTLPTIILPSGRRAVLREDLRGAVERCYGRASDRPADQRSGRMRC